MNVIKRGFPILILLILPCCAFACLWDRDTLAHEARGIPDVIQIITGRFERNPPLFYEMRLKRVTEWLKVHPEDLSAYDDAGVACDRLSRDDEAIAWMERKRLCLEQSRSAETQEQRYRYYANVGTFWA